VWAWQFHAVRNGARYLVGAMTEQDPEDPDPDAPVDGRVFVEHRRTLIENIRRLG